MEFLDQEGLIGRRHIADSLAQGRAYARPEIHPHRAAAPIIRLATIAA